MQRTSRGGIADVPKEETRSVGVHAHPVAITIFVKNPNATHDGCKIHYRDIGDYLTREQKLEDITRGSIYKRISAIGRAITPDRHRLRLDRTSAAMRLLKFYPLGTIGSKSEVEADDAIFQIVFIRVIDEQTGDAYIYNFSRDMLVLRNAQQMTQDYLACSFRSQGEP